MKPWYAIDHFTADLQRYLNKYDKTDKAAVGGYNVTFDLQFLSQWFKKGLDRYGLGSFTDYSMLDAAPMMRLMRQLGHVDIINTKLATVCNYYDVPFVDAHNSMGDAEAAMQVYPYVLHDFREMLGKEHYFGQLTAGEIS